MKEEIFFVNVMWISALAVMALILGFALNAWRKRENAIGEENVLNRLSVAREYFKGMPLLLRIYDLLYNYASSAKRSNIDMELWAKEYQSSIDQYNDMTAKRGLYNEIDRILCEKFSEEFHTNNPMEILDEIVHVFKDAQLLRNRVLLFDRKPGDEPQSYAAAVNLLNNNLDDLEKLKGSIDNINLQYLAVNPMMGHNRHGFILSGIRKSLEDLKLYRDGINNALAPYFYGENKAPNVEGNLNLLSKLLSELDNYRHDITLDMNSDIARKIRLDRVIYKLRNLTMPNSEDRMILNGLIAAQHYLQSDEICNLYVLPFKDESLSYKAIGSVDSAFLSGIDFSLTGELKKSVENDSSENIEKGDDMYNAWFFGDEQGRAKRRAFSIADTSHTIAELRYIKRKANHFVRAVQTAYDNLAKTGFSEESYEAERKNLSLYKSELDYFGKLRERIESLIPASPSNPATPIEIPISGEAGKINNS